MKTILKLALASALFVASQNATFAAEPMDSMAKVKVEEEPSFIPAIRLITKPDGTSSFEEGKIPTFKHAGVKTFWLSDKVEPWEMNTHKAPRRQYVITLKGQLRFKVSDGSTFIIKPGVILLAEDTAGEGHSWEMVNENEGWERLYVPMNEGADDMFIANK